MNSKKRAYVSVYNKERIVEFCQYLVEYGYEIVATEGTCKVLTEAGIKAISAHELTGYPEPLGGKIRALHPAIYTGIIANELSEEQLSELGDKDIYPIELVVVNCYPFVEDMEAGVDLKEAASHIDSNGVALLNAAAKNYLHTVVVCDPDDYDRVLCDLAAGAIPEDVHGDLRKHAGHALRRKPAPARRRLSRALLKGRFARPRPSACGRADDL